MSIKRFAAFNTTSVVTSSINQGNSILDLRPCQRAYLGESNARRLLKRSYLTKKARERTTSATLDTDEPIFALHEEAALEAAASAAAAPSLLSEAQSLGYSVQCYATFAEDERKRLDAETAEKEKLLLFHSINSSRHAEGCDPLRLKPLLAKYAQDYADMLSAEDASSTDPVPATHDAVVIVMSPSGSRVARFVSPPRIGALACGELWYGGKYKRHLYDPVVGNGGSEKAHPDDCPCHLRIVFETLVDAGGKAVGIGRGEDSRWVVEVTE